MLRDDSHWEYGEKLLAKKEKKKKEEKEYNKHLEKRGRSNGRKRTMAK